MSHLCCEDRTCLDCTFVDLMIARHAWPTGRSLRKRRGLFDGCVPRHGGVTGELLQDGCLGY